MFELFFLGVLFFAIVLSLVLCVKAFYLVKQSEVVIIERFGRYDRTLYPGLHFVVPFVDAPHRVRRMDHLLQ